MRYFRGHFKTAAKILLKQCHQKKITTISRFLWSVEKHNNWFSNNTIRSSLNARRSHTPVQIRSCILVPYKAENILLTLFAYFPKTSLALKSRVPGPVLDVRSWIPNLKTRIETGENVTTTTYKLKMFSKII